MLTLDNTMTIEIQTWLTGLGSALFAWFLKDGINMIREGRKERSAKAIIDMGAVYDVLNDVVQVLGADRGLILYTTNGGGIPAASKSVNVTILYETIRGQGLSPIRSDWQGVPIDQGYVRMLSSVVQDGHWTGSPDDLEPGCLLRALYEGEQVKKAWVHEICRTEKKYFYISLRWLEGHDAPDDARINKELVIATTKIKKILKDSPE